MKPKQEEAFSFGFFFGFMVALCVVAIVYVFWTAAVSPLEEPDSGIHWMTIEDHLKQCQSNVDSMIENFKAMERVADYWKEHPQCPEKAYPIVQPACPVEPKVICSPVQVHCDGRKR